MWTAAWKIEKFSEAIEWFAKKRPISRDEWDALDERARRKAFTVAGVAQLDLVTEVKASLEKAVEAGQSLDEWRKEIGPKLEAAWAGSVANPPWRLETIFRTNAQTAYAAGRYRQATDPDVLMVRPFWRFDAVLDGRTSPVCKRCNKTLRPASDPWWDGHYPPCHHACRSTVVTLSKREAERLGGETPPVDVAAPQGFARLPGKTEWAPEPDDYPPEHWRIFRRTPAANDNGKALKPPKDIADARATELGQKLGAGLDGKLGRGPDAHEKRKTRERGGREALRSAIQSHDPAMVSRDAEGTEGAQSYGGRGADQLRVERMPGCNGLHYQTGLVSVDSKVHGYATSATQKLADKRSTLAEKVARLEFPETDALRVLVHEELHGFSPCIGEAFAGKAAGIEEATTELLARAVTRDVLRIDTASIAERSPHTSIAAPVYEDGRWYARGVSYHDYIRALCEHVEAAGIPRERVVETIESAARIIRHAGPAATTPEAFIQRFVDAIPLDNGGRAKLLRSLLEGPYDDEP